MQPVVAQSGVTIYGTLDVSLDSAHKSEGDVQGTFQSIGVTDLLPNRIAAPAQTQTRVATGLTAPSHFGFKGVEDMGSGWKGKFQLEGALIPDNGGLGSDNRLFGRMAWVGLTTPLGEVRLGRQAAPMLSAYYLNSLERLGSTDLIAGGIALNNLQVFQDNMIGYTIQTGAWLVQASYSPNAGVASRVSAARSTATPSTPAATEATGQILGGATAGAESNGKRGRTAGAMAAYLGENWRLIGALHHNEFDATVGLARPDGSFVPLFNAKSYRSYMLGGTYSIAATGTDLAINHHRGTFKEAGRQDPDIATWAIAIKQAAGQFDLIAQLTKSSFLNFTKGSDTAIMLGADYKLSKRTALYLRAGQLKDDRGQVVRSPLSGVGLAGGPVNLLLPLGSLEVPLFSGAGTNMDATTRLIGVGLRHSF
ncbi:MAG: porin [Rubrivivax sp.]|nr:MAG: porin [Rubrivivax sp.]